MKLLLLTLWQLPQWLTAQALRALWRKHIIGRTEFNGSRVYHLGLPYGASFGLIIFLSDYFPTTSLYHESGHSRQSLYLGPLYLPFIGLPSFVGNIYDRIAHKSWAARDRQAWYYAQPWEAWADRLGGVERGEEV
jgi:hypothetical protein